jgi:acylphosphatase
MPIQYDIRFTGTVQGVGFRYTTRGLAADHDVSGWVRNEPDGSVRCVVEGASEELDRFLAAVRDAMSGCIVEVSVQKEAATGGFTNFTISR